MSVLVYYLRAKSKAHIAMVKLLKEMLYLEGKDKEFLLANIKKLTHESPFVFDDSEVVLKSKRHMKHSRNNSCSTWVFTPGHSRNPSYTNPRKCIFFFRQKKNIIKVMNFFSFIFHFISFK